MADCNHLGRIDKDLPCPEPACAAGVEGRALVVPTLPDDGPFSEAAQPFTTQTFARVHLVDRQLGRYWRWGGIEGPVYIPRMEHAHA